MVYKVVQTLLLRPLGFPLLWAVLLVLQSRLAPTTLWSVGPFYFQGNAASQRAPILPRPPERTKEKRKLSVRCLRLVTPKGEVSASASQGDKSAATKVEGFGGVYVYNSTENRRNCHWHFTPQGDLSDSCSQTSVEEVEVGHTSAAAPAEVLLSAAAYYGD